SDVNAVVHAHPPVSTGFACAGSPIDYAVFPEVIAMIGEIRFVGYETPTTRELAEKIAENIRGVEALLLENHGIITVGSNLEQAYQRAELLEDFAKITLVAKLLGGPKRLPDAEVRKIMGLESEKYRLRLAKGQRKGD
ncbi:MAG: class II aldolase/adducin family protein, partial [Candidatus Bathyarchaeia archaeon]